jgi:alpha-tubulin suppressor-like RCC1 family protein
MRDSWKGLLSLTAILSAMSGCGETIITDPPPPPADGAILSDPAPDVGFSGAVSRAGGSVAFSVAAQAVPGGGNVAYISLPSNSYPTGTFARIQGSGATGTVTSAMIEGGLDPVPIPAMDGDSIEIEILSTDLVRLDRIGGRIPRTRRPKVVRTVPPRGKTDVAVNAAIVVVFSEPIDATSLSSTAIRLSQNGTPVAGTSQILEGATAAVVVRPQLSLAPNTVYRLVVTQAVRDLDGDALEQEVTVEFTSGSTFAADVQQLTLAPDVTALPIGSRLQLIARASSGDDTTRVPLEVAGVPLLWTSDNPAIATVSATGLVTAVRDGEARIHAHVLPNLYVSGSALVQVSGSQAPVASLELPAVSDTTPITGKIELVAITRDSTGAILLFRPVVWQTTNAAVATVEPGSTGKAWVTGHSSGTAFIIAASEGRSDSMRVEVVAPGAYEVMTVGANSTCGLRGVWAFCWGQNASGRVGDGTSNSWMLPRAVSGGLRFAQISTGHSNTCALTAAGEAYCWGSNDMGSLGLGTANAPEQCEFAGPCSRTPIAVPGERTFSQIHVSPHPGSYRFVCGIASTGATYCWGNNVEGTLGIGSATGPETCTTPGGTMLPCSRVPLEVAGGHVFTSITLGDMHACGLTPTGEAYCWGNNSVGQLGDGTASGRLTPVAVTGGLRFVSLSAGSQHTCGLTADGTAYCWGFSGTGALGHGSFSGPDFCQNPDPLVRPLECSTAPEPVTGGLSFATIDAGAYHTCALTRAGVAYCWGFNSSGQLGTPPTSNSASPVAVMGGLIFASLSAGYEHTCGITTSSLAYCWGSNSNYALGTDELPLPSPGAPIRVKGQP